MFLRIPKERRGEITSTLASSITEAKSVLVVDDHEPFLQLLSRETIAGDVDFVGVTSCAEARDAIGKEDFDVVILDYKLTNGSGVDLYREMVEKRIKTQVVFLSAYVNEDLLRKVQMIGPARVYSKDRVADQGFCHALFVELGLCR